MKALLKKLIERTPYRIVRATAKNRFQAIEESLRQLGGRGYLPRRIVDGGANVGEFARLCRSVFPGVEIDLVEPQPACLAALEALSRAHGFTLYPFALGSVEGELQLAIDPDAVTTGAHVLVADMECDAERRVSVSVTTLDSILEDISASDRTLLKIDLQGWEMEALVGGEAVLPRIEVILCEVSFYSQVYEPTIETLLEYLADRGFVLYDIASIAARERDNRARQADFVFVRRDSQLVLDSAWS